MVVSEVSPYPASDGYMEAILPSEVGTYKTVKARF